MTAEDRLFDAVHGGDAAVVAQLAKAHPALLRQGWPGGGGASYLHLAAHRGHLAVCQALVKAGDDIDGLRPPDGAVPLHLAAAAGHVDLTRWLLGQGAAVDGGLRSFGTPLMAAAMEGHAQVLEVLLQAGAEVNREHLRLPQTALDFAELYRVKQTGQAHTAELLRAAGGVRPYLSSHDWSGHRHGEVLAAWEQALDARVSPLSLAEEEGALPAVFRTRLPKKFSHQLLFTVGGAGDSVLVCLPSEWPLCERARSLAEWRWPIDALRSMSAALARKPAAAPVDTAVAGSGQRGEPATWWVVSRPTLSARRPGGRPVHVLVAPPAARSAPKPATLAKLPDAKWDALALPMPAGE